MCCLHGVMRVEVILPSLLLVRECLQVLWYRSRSCNSEKHEIELYSCVQSTGLAFTTQAYLDHARGSGDNNERTCSWRHSHCSRLAGYNQAIQTTL